MDLSGGKKNVVPSCNILSTCTSCSCNVFSCDHLKLAHNVILSQSLTTTELDEHHQHSSAIYVTGANL